MQSAKSKKPSKLTEKDKEEIVHWAFSITRNKWTSYGGTYVWEIVKSPKKGSNGETRFTIVLLENKNIIEISDDSFIEGDPEISTKVELLKLKAEEREMAIRTKRKR